MTEMKQNTKFQKGNKAAVGRKTGSQNTSRSLIEIIGTEKAELLIQKMTEQALSGDVSAGKILIDKLLPAAKQQNIVFTDVIRNIHTQTDVNERTTELLNNIGEGVISTQDGDALIALIGAKSATIQKCIGEQLDAMRAQIAELQGNK